MSQRGWPGRALLSDSAHVAKVPHTCALRKKRKEAGPGRRCMGHRAPRAYATSRYMGHRAPHAYAAMNPGMCLTKEGER